MPINCLLSAFIRVHRCWYFFCIPCIPCIPANAVLELSDSLSDRQPGAGARQIFAEAKQAEVVLQLRAKI
jgi:hypothetical protein